MVIFRKISANDSTYKKNKAKHIKFYNEFVAYLSIDSPESSGRPKSYASYLIKLITVYEESFNEIIEDLYSTETTDKLYGLMSAPNFVEYNKKENRFPSATLNSLKKYINNELQTKEQYTYKIAEEDIKSMSVEEGHEDISTGKEGAKKERYVNVYERNIKNRQKAIELHGSRCFACGFDFEEVYGERGRGFIEIHHVVPLSTVGEEVQVNPLTDLIPLCSNCHRMVHRKFDDVLSLEQLKDILRIKK